MIWFESGHSVYSPIPSLIIFSSLPFWLSLLLFPHLFFFFFRCVELSSVPNLSFSSLALFLFLSTLSSFFSLLLFSHSPLITITSSPPLLSTSLSRPVTSINNSDEEHSAGHSLLTNHLSKTAKQERHDHELDRRIHLRWRTYRPGRGKRHSAPKHRTCVPDLRRRKWKPLCSLCCYINPQLVLHGLPCRYWLLPHGSAHVHPPPSNAGWTVLTRLTIQSAQIDSVNYCLNSIELLFFICTMTPNFPRSADHLPKSFTFLVYPARRAVAWTSASLRRKRSTNALPSSAGCWRNQGRADPDTSLSSRQQEEEHTCTMSDSGKLSRSIFSARTKWSAWSQVRLCEPTSSIAHSLFFAWCSVSPYICSLWGSDRSYVVAVEVGLTVSNLLIVLIPLLRLILEGLNFLITEIPFEVFTYSETDPMCFEETPEDPFPYMVRFYNNEFQSTGTSPSCPRLVYGKFVLVWTNNPKLFPWFLTLLRPFYFGFVSLLTLDQESGTTITITLTSAGCYDEDAIMDRTLQRQLLFGVFFEHGSDRWSSLVAFYRNFSILKVTSATTFERISGTSVSDLDLFERTIQDWRRRQGQLLTALLHFFLVIRAVRRRNSLGATLTIDWRKDVWWYGIQFSALASTHPTIPTWILY